MLKKLLFVSAFAIGINSTFAQTNVYAFGFDSDFPSSWSTTNQSEEATDTEWNKATYTSASTVLNSIFGSGIGGVPKGQAGGNNSFALVNYTSTDSGTISNWLVTSAVDVKDGDVVSFYTRKGTDGNTDYPDRLELRYSTAATTVAPASGPTDVGSFTTLGVSVNPNLVKGFVYPKVWTKYSFTVSGVGSTVKPVTFGFRYYVADGGPNGSNSDIIGIDTFSVDRPELAVSDINKKTVSIYPNPTADFLTFSQKVNTAEVYDMTGKLVASPEITDSKIDVRTLQNGAYILKISTAEGSTSHKFLKK